MLAKITVRTDTAANWTSSNPTLVAGEITSDTTAKRFKVGEAAAYASVPFQDSGPHTTEATVASATTCDIGAATSINVSITGTTTITGLGTVAAGTIRIGRFTGALTLTHNGTSLILPGAANIVTVAGDRFIAESLGSGNWVVINYTRASGLPVVEYIPQNSRSAAYTTTLADSGDHILHPSADTTARTWTIDSNANVPYPIGTAITFVNQNSAGVITIAITTDTMRLAGAGTTGNRTLAANGIATALKITSTEWIISGTGLT